MGIGIFVQGRIIWNLKVVKIGGKLTQSFFFESCGLNQNLSEVIRIIKNHVLKIRIVRAKTISVRECVLELRT